MFRRKTVQLSVLFLMFSCLLLPAHAEEQAHNFVPVLSLLLLSSKDCNGDNHGTAYLDACDNCVGGNTRESPCNADGTVTSAGQIWMDRNLGASRVATSSTDADAYGDLYQWGRGTDGHEERTSNTTSETSDDNTPIDDKFIIGGFDWRTTPNDNLWQGVSGTNNPCPTGFRLPTNTELEAERTSWSSNNSAGAYASPLKLVVAGDRGFDGSLYSAGSNGIYWSSTVNFSDSYYLYFSSDVASTVSNFRSFGLSVRCLKD